MSQSSLPRVRLLPKAKPQAIRHGFPWVYANELVLDRRTKALAPGALAVLQDAERRDLALVTVNPAVIEEFALPLGASGVLIADPGPYGARAGLRRGDIMREIDGRPTPDTAAAAAALRAAGRVLVLRVVRDGRRLSLRLRL